MHYITGASFSVKKFGNVIDKKFVLNVPYYLTNIKPGNPGMIYTFKSPNAPAVEITFESCQVADTLIARHRGEKLPNYGEIYNRRSHI